MDHARKPPLRLHFVMAITGVLFLYTVARFIVPVLLGACLAGVVMPIFRRIRSTLRLSNATAAGITTLLFVGGLLMPFTVLSIAAVRSVLELVEILRARFAVATSGNGNVADSIFHEEWVRKIMAKIESITPVTEPQLRETAATVVQKVAVVVGDVLGKSLQNIPQGVVFVFILIVALYYVMVDGARLEAWIIEQSPFSRDDTIGILAQVKDTSARTLGSSVVVSLVQSSLLLLGMLISGVPAPFIWFTVAFVMAFLPLIGSVPVSVGCVVYLAAQGMWGMAGLMGALAVAAGLSDNVIRPLVIGSGEKAQHPLITLMSIFGGLWVMGFAGLFLGPVIASLFLALLERYASRMQLPEAGPVATAAVPAVKHDA